METFEEREKRQEKESKRTGAIVTAVAHSIIILFLVVTMAWLPPDPPIPRYGIEVDLGVGIEGFGDIENPTKPNDSESLEEARPNPTPKHADPVPVKPTVKPDVSTPKPDITPAQDNADKAVVVPEKVDPKPKPTETAKADTPVKPSSSDGKGKSDTDLASNQGNAQGKVGDAGQANGNINADAVLGGGSGGGAHLSLDGWKWDSPPVVKDASTETGSVTIQFKIDDEGTVVSAKVAGGYTVSPGVAEYYRSYVEREMSFTPKGGGKVASYTLGAITFIITTK